MVNSSIIRPKQELIRVQSNGKITISKVVVSGIFAEEIVTPSGDKIQFQELYTDNNMDDILTLILRLK